MDRKIFVLGYPGDIGGASTELWNTLKLWKRFGIQATLVPTWQADPKWEMKTKELGFETLIDARDFSKLQDGIVVSFCNSEFLRIANEFQTLNCKTVWVNCMTWLFDAEKKLGQCFDAYVFQSRYQQRILEPQLAPLGYDLNQGHLIHGAFDFDSWEYQPRPHVKGEPFVRWPDGSERSRQVELQHVEDLRQHPIR